MTLKKTFICAALLPRADDPHDYWLIDMENKKTIANWQTCIEQAKYLLCLDSKAFLNKHPEFLKKSHFICLSTMKKLISKDHTATLKVPQWENVFDAVAWLSQVYEKALLEIKRRDIAPLLKLECELIPVLVQMEKIGFPFIKEKWLEALEKIANEQAKIKQKLAPYFQQEGFLLFGSETIDLHQTNRVKERLEKIIGKKLSSTSASVLKDIDHEAAHLLMRYREHEKMLSTYGEHFLPKIINNRIHASFVAIASSSGRSTCLNPNLQALPNDTTFQACVESPQPYELKYFDYSGFELRILAALSKDPKLSHIFNEDRDIHSVVAQNIFKCEVSEKKNPHLRSKAKILNFGIIYGMGEATLARQLKTSQHEAQQLMENYFKNFSQVKNFLDSLETQAKNNGFVQTALGRRSYFDHDIRKNLGHMLRLARNIPIQGTGAEIFKLALIKVSKSFDKNSLNARIVNMVHDEIVVECHKDCVEQAKKIIIQQMHQAFNAILPNLKAAIGMD